VVFGTVVTMVDLDTDEEMRYQLLGPEESDVKSGSISVLSPFGQALIGKEVGDEVVVHTPSGKRLLEIMNIEPATA
jgi:transcription elongation factor GreA